MQGATFSAGFPLNSVDGRNTNGHGFLALLHIVRLIVHTETSGQLNSLWCD